MKRKEFLASLAVLAGAAFIPETKASKLTLPTGTSNADMTIGVNGIERMRIYANGNVAMGILNPKQILKVNNNI